MGRSECAGDAKWQRRAVHRGVANQSQQGKVGDRKHHTTAPWDWETSRHGVVNHGSTMGSLTRGGRENALNSETIVRCLQGLGLTLKPPG